MPQPPVEVDDIIRAAGDAFFDGSRRWLTWFHVKVLTAILYCRTPGLGGHVNACSRCDYQAIAYNSCRNRHCPKRQTNARDRWLEARCRDRTALSTLCSATGAAISTTRNRRRASDRSRRAT